MTNIIEKVAEIYAFIVSQQDGNPALAGDCKACGKCCNFTEFDHLLYVTGPEIEYLKYHLENEKLKPMQYGICPYKFDSKCTIYDWRFAGCRIFNCTGDKDLQNQLTETVLEKLRKLCSDNYNYMELSKALNKK